MQIAVGIPAYNEEKNIASIILQLKKITNTIIVCNDGSEDLTGSIAKELGVIVENHSKNIGYGGAIKTLFLKARELQVDVLVTFDADGQHHVEDIEAAIVESFRVVRPGGYIVFIEPNRYHPLQILHGLASKHERGTLRFSMRKIRNIFNKYFQNDQFWIEPLNTYLYVRKTFPGRALRELFIFFEDIFEYHYISTHYLIMARK